MLLVFGQNSQMELGEQLRELLHLFFWRKNCRSEMPASSLKSELSEKLESSCDYLLSEARACDDANAGLLEQQRAVVCIGNKTFLASFFDELFWKFDIWESVHSALNRE